MNIAVMLVLTVEGADVVRTQILLPEAIIAAGYTKIRQVIAYLRILSAITSSSSSRVQHQVAFFVR
jgi:hypothetical protein